MSILSHRRKFFAAAVGILALMSRLRPARASGPAPVDPELVAAARHLQECRRRSAEAYDARDRFCDARPGPLEGGTWENNAVCREYELTVYDPVIHAECDADRALVAALEDRGLLGCVVDGELHVVAGLNWDEGFIGSHPAGRIAGL